jgi:hypothetical protein
MRRLISIPIVFLIFSSFCCGQIVSVRGSGRVDSTSSKEPGQSNVPAPDVLTNRDVIELVSMGLPDDIVSQKIQTATSTRFDLSVAGLKQLKAVKVPDSVIRIMLNPKVPISPAPYGSAANDSHGLPQSVGVYISKKGEYIEIEPEIVGWKTGGVLKQTATLGFDKQHVNGKVMGPQSPTRLSNPVELIIRTVEGTSATEFQLLRLYKKENRREFRSVTGGVLHSTGDAERTRLPMNVEKIADRTWRVRLDRLSTGEYGILPPGISSASIGASGKIYSFSIVE